MYYILVTEKLPPPTHRHRNTHKSRHKVARHGHRQTRTQKSSANNNNHFIHGNYNRYYGYRSVDKLEVDPRVRVLKPSWFTNKSVLDIGCNIGEYNSYYNLLN